MPKTNSYFNGKVASIAFQSDTLPATVGVMEAGEYEFATSQFEMMTVLSGSLAVKLPNAAEWQTFRKGESFTIDAQQKFQVKTEKDAAYYCTYA